MYPRITLELVTETFGSGEHSVNHKSRVKGKAIPLQAWTGPEVSRRLPDFKTIGT